jgi:predicted ATPase/DNA-binding XRE family transcriptional regulator
LEADSPASFAALLRDYRVARGLTQEALAERAGVTRGAISLLERGLRRSARRHTAAALARALALSTGERSRLFAAAGSQRRRAHGAVPAEAGLPRTFPVRLTSFIGRERELAEVEDLLREKRLVTLAGAGGVGKTSLAWAVAARVQDQFHDGVALIELAALSDGALVPQAIASVLGVRERPGEPFLTTLATALGPSRRLLVLDNCEHLVEACARVVEGLLQRCPKLRILATGREPLRIGAEVIWRVPSLTLPGGSSTSIPDLVESEAVRLFVERAGAVQPRFALTTSNAAAVAEICRRLDGIPLAIELGAARTGMLTPEQIARHLSDRFRLLTTGSRTAPPRHQTLRATLDWSYGLLSEEERVLFRRLAAFAGGWSLEAAEDVCADGAVASRDTTCDLESPVPHPLSVVRPEWVLGLLLGLVDKSLVFVEERDGQARYRMLETIREYALDQLGTSGEASDGHRRHARWAVRVADAAQPAIHTE